MIVRLKNGLIMRYVRVVFLYSDGKHFLLGELSDKTADPDMIEVSQVKSIEDERTGNITENDLD